jgi:hypothetical protein
VVPATNVHVKVDLETAAHVTKAQADRTVVKVEVRVAEAEVAVDWNLIRWSD